MKKKIKTVGKADVDKASYKALEKEKKYLAKKVKTLELTLSEWETRQFTNVKLISGLEKERDSLQLKLKEMKDGISLMKISYTGKMLLSKTATRKLNL